MIEQLSEATAWAPPLSTYYFYLTGGCNLACRHCWLAPTFQRDGNTGGHLDLELFKLAIEEGLPLGLNNVKLTGGEPLLHPDFVRIVDFLYEKQVPFRIETNAVLMTPGLARYLRERSTLYHISISLDGATAETHDSFRNVRGSFDKACQAARDLSDLGIHPQIIMSLHRDNVHEIEALLQLSLSLGAGSVKFNLIHSSGRADQMAAHGQVLSVGRLIELGRWIESDLHKRYPIPIAYGWPPAFQSLNHLLQWPDRCGIFGILGVLPTGQLATCGIGEQIPELCYGQLGRDSVADVWERHPMLLAIRRTLPDELEGICGACLLRSHCLGHCVANNYHAMRRLSAPYWFCDAAHEQGLFPASRLR